MFRRGRRDFPAARWKALAERSAIRTRPQLLLSCSLSPRGRGAGGEGTNDPSEEVALSPPTPLPRGCSVARFVSDGENRAATEGGPYRGRPSVGAALRGGPGCPSQARTSQQSTPRGEGRKTKPGRPYPPFWGGSP